MITEAEYQEMAKRDAWRIACLNLGASLDQVADYEQSAKAFATTTALPNHVITETALEAAHQALQRGEPMPQDAEEAVQRYYALQLVRLFR